MMVQKQITKMSFQVSKKLHNTKVIRVLDFVFFFDSRNFVPYKLYYKPVGVF
jgi:hypothetical protein